MDECGGKIDIYDRTLKEAWEVKLGQAGNFQDIFQLFAYMSFMGPKRIKKGHLVARGDVTSAEIGVEHVRKEYGMTIELEKLEEYYIDCSRRKIKAHK